MLLPKLRNLKSLIFHKYYLLKYAIQKTFNMYRWIYSIFGDNTNDFEKKYSKYGSTAHKRRKQNESSSFYTNYNSNKYYHQTNNTQQETSTKRTYDKPTDRFFADCNYEVLGVPYGSDFKTIVRPAYIRLINTYHTDKITKENEEDRQLFEDISKAINLAYDNLKREHLK